MNKLSKREKLLLYVLALVVILSVSIFYLIIPAYGEINDIKAQVEEVRFEKLQIEIKLKTQDSLYARIDKIYGEINNASAAFIEYMPSEEISLYITNLLEGHNIIAENLIIISGKTVSVSDDTADGGKVLVEGVLKSTVNVEATGSLSDIIALIDYMETSEKTIFLTDFTANGNYNNRDNAVNISFDIEVYMYDPAQ